MPDEGEDYLVPLGQARVCREGGHATVLTYSMMVHKAMKAAEMLASEGIDLEVVDLVNAGKRSILRISVDQDGGISDTVLTEASKTVDAVIEGGSLMGDRPYTLEVSSPGIDRPLSLPRHWRRNTGRLVKVTQADGAKFTGRITQAEEDSVVLDVNGHSRTVALGDVAKARVQVEFNRAED